MKKASWALALMCAFLLAACATVPEKATEADSLVVIKTEVSNPRGLERGHEMVFHFSGGYPDSWVGQYSWDFNLVVVKESGVMLESYGAVLQAGRGESKVHPVNFPLPYVPGGVAVADFVFTMKIEETAMYETTTTTGFRRITQQERDQLVETLRKDGRFTGWMRAGQDTQQKQETPAE